MVKKKGNESPPRTRSSERQKKARADSQPPDVARKGKTEHLWNISQTTSRALDYSDGDGPNTEDFEGWQIWKINGSLSKLQ